MNINGQHVNINDLISDEYMHIKINNSIYLSKYQMNILDMYKIDYKNCSSMKELLYSIEEVLEEDDYDDLEEISKQIAEFDYYHNTNK